MTALESCLAIQLQAATAAAGSIRPSIGADWICEGVPEKRGAGAGCTCLLYTSDVYKRQKESWDGTNFIALVD